jgi:hypothetical protein
MAADAAPGTCTLITGATKSTYKVLAADKAAGYLRVRVTATSTAGATVRVSAAKKFSSNSRSAHPTTLAFGWGLLFLVALA